MDLADQIEIFLIDTGDWTPASVLCARFSLDQRTLRAHGDRPGLLDHCAVSSHLGYKHISRLTTEEWLAVKHRLRRHAAGQFRKTKRWDQARHNSLTGLKPHQIERHTGQHLLPL
jgi:hypothetical protein